MVDKTTPRLALPLPYLTNTLKIDVGKLTSALTMLDANAVMLNDWLITADGWQKMGTLTGLAQGNISASLMVITGTGFANIVMQTGNGSVTTVGDPARAIVTAQTNLGVNQPHILGGKLVEVAKDNYEIWFNLAAGTATSNWSGLLIAGSGATIDWTHSNGAQPAGGVPFKIARSLTDQEMVTDALTDDGTVLTAGYAGLLGMKIPYHDFTASADTLITHNWRANETLRIKSADATTANGFPAGVTGSGSSGWRFHCESSNEDSSIRVFVVTSENATPTWVYRITLSAGAWSTPRRMYTSDNPPKASEVSAIAQLATISTVVNLNDRILPAYYGAISLTSVTGSVAANNFPYDEPGQLVVLPFGSVGGVTQIYTTVSGRIAVRNYDGSVFTNWRKGANSGANDDITQLTALSGPMKLGGDGVGDYDAVTMRQLKASSGGSGPTMSGVMNNFIGSVLWFNGTRAKLPAGYVPADGQALSRVVNPDLAAAIDSGMLNSVTDANWINSGDAARPSAWRTSFSQGGAAGTSPGGVTPDAWCRVPDLNGVQLNSIKHLFLSGSSGASQEPSVGQVWNQSSPNISGAISSVNTGVFSAGGTGPFNTGNQLANYPAGAAGSNAFSYLLFNANQANKSYGRGAQYQTDPGSTGGQLGDLYPNHAVGIWIVRVSGAFTAANTAFSVMTSDAVRPSNNTVTVGGVIKSDYQIGGVSESTISLYSSNTIAGTYSAYLDVYNKTKSVTKTFKFTDFGDFVVPGGIYASNQILTTTNVTTLPSNGTGFQAKSLASAYAVNGVVEVQADFYPFGNVGSAYGAAIQVYSKPKGGYKWFNFYDTGDMQVPGNIAATQYSSTQNNSGYSNFYNGSAFRTTPFIAQQGVENSGTIVAAQVATTGQGFYGGVGFGWMTTGGNSWPIPQIIAATSDINGSGVFPSVAAWRFNPVSGDITILAQQGNFIVQKSGASDLALKKEVQDTDGVTSLDNINAMELKTFIYINDPKNRVRRGVIAQQVQEIDPDYVHAVPGFDGTEPTLALDSNPLLMDALAAIKVLTARIVALENK